MTLVTAFLCIGALGYAVASVILWIGALRRVRLAADHAVPSVTVVIPARNEAHNLPALFRALERQTYPRDLWQTILVDDRSDDGTGEMARTLAATLPVVVRVMTVESAPSGWSPKKHAITRAVAESESEVILTTDADCRPEPGWIAGMVGTLVTARVDLVAGYSPYDRRDTVAGRLLALETLAQGFLTMAGIGIGWPITCQGRSFGYRRQVFADVGGFGPARSMLSGDDHLLLQRAVGMGFRAAYCDAPNARVWTDPPQKWEEFVHQRVRMFSGAGKLKPGVALLGGAVYGWLLAMIGGMLALYPVAWAAFAGKALFDAVSLAIAARRLGEWRLMSVYPMAAVLYLPYFLVFALLGTFGTYRWKGRKGR